MACVSWFRVIIFGPFIYAAHLFPSYMVKPYSSEIYMCRLSFS